MSLSQTKLVSQNIIRHQEGLNKRDQLIKNQLIEIELGCINSDYHSDLEIQQLLEKALKLINLYPENSILKESEFHELHSPYYELSLFCQQEDLVRMMNEIKTLELVIDVVHN